MFLMSRQISRSALSLALILGAATCFADTLRISAIPDEAPNELQRKFKPLGEYLGALKNEVQHVPGGNVLRWERTTNT